MDNGAIEMTCLVASEVGVPAVEKPVCWLLLTNREAPTVEQAKELIKWYRARWEPVGLGASIARSGLSEDSFCWICRLIASYETKRR